MILRLMIGQVDAEIRIQCSVGGLFTLVSSEEGRKREQTPRSRKTENERKEITQAESRRERKSKIDERIDGAVSQFVVKRPGRHGSMQNTKEGKMGLDCPPLTRPDEGIYIRKCDTSILHVQVG